MPAGAAAFRLFDWGGPNVRLQATGSFVLYAVLLQTDNLGGQWKPEDYLTSMLGQKDGRWEKIDSGRLLSEDHIQQKYRLCNKQAALLLSLADQLLDGNIAIVTSGVAAARADPSYEDLATYLDWFEGAAAPEHRNRLMALRDHLPAESVPQLRQRLADQDVLVVPHIFLMATQLTSAV